MSSKLISPYGVGAGIGEFWRLVLDTSRPPKLEEYLQVKDADDDFIESGPIDHVGP